MRGWFVPEDGRIYTLWAVVGKDRIRAFAGLPRPDVVCHHQHNPAFLNPGFLVRFRRPELEPHLSLIATTETQEIILAENIPAPEFGAVYEPDSDPKYREWLRTKEASLFWQEEDIAQSLQSLSYQPLISIFVRAVEDHIYLLNRSVESVLGQHYRRWELCIQSEPSEFLEQIAQGDGRVRLTSHDPLSAARGDFIVRLDYRDELHPFALAEIVRTLNANEHTDLVYSDEDEMDFHGNRVRPFFKPDFDAEIFSSWNFIGHMAAVRRSVLLEAGGYQLDDWDTMFRVIDVSRSTPLRIPKPLYHFRKGNDTLAPLPRTECSGCAETIGARTKKSGVKASVEPGLFPGSFRLHHERSPSRKTAVFVRAEDGAFQHATLAANIDRETTRVYELLGSGSELLSGDEGRTIRSLDEMPEDVFIFINRPLETLNHGFFDELAAQAMREDCGVVTGISLDRKGRLLPLADPAIGELIGISFFQRALLRDVRVVRSVAAISGEFFAVKRAQLVSLGGWEAVHSTRMPELAARLVDLTHSSHARALLTPYAVATFDLDINWKEPMQSEFPAEADPARAERNLAAAQLREIASERNRLRRDIASMQETITRLESEDLRLRVEELKEALETERRAAAEMRNSGYWKIIRPLRACVRLLRGGS